MDTRISIFYISTIFASQYDVTKHEGAELVTAGTGLALVYRSVPNVYDEQLAALMLTMFEKN